MKRIVIVGAGPIGCYLGQLLKRKGKKPLLIEEHKELGRPVHCAGLVGKKVFQEAEIKLPQDSILNVINGATIYIDEGKLAMQRKEVAYVIDREKFDKSLGKDLDIRFETKCLGLQKENDHYIVETDKGCIEADIIVGADGARSVLREYVAGNHIDYLKGVQFRVELKSQQQDMVKVFVKKPYFYWIIPESKTVARIGVLSQNPYHDLLNFIREKKLKGKILEKFAGIVPLTHFNSLVKERVFLVGDSASQIKPLSYGGVYMGMRAAEILAESLFKAKFKQYPSLWKKRFGSEINIALRAREIIQKLSNEELKDMFSFAKERVKVIESKGDFENHSLLAWEFLKDPQASKRIIGILLKIIKSGFRRG